MSNHGRTVQYPTSLPIFPARWWDYKHGPLLWGSFGYYRMCTPGRFVDQQMVAYHWKWLQGLYSSDNPVFGSNRLTFKKLHDCSHELEGLPVTIDNEDINLTNIMAGIVDWEGFAYTLLLWASHSISSISSLYAGLQAPIPLGKILSRLRVGFGIYCFEISGHITKIPEVHRTLEVAFQIGYVRLATTGGRMANSVLYDHIVDYAAYKIPRVVSE